MEKERKQKKALVTSRVLFYSVLDKIYVVIFALYFLSGLIAGLLRKHMTVGNTFTYYIVFLIGAIIMALLMNWFYRCAIKTMLCITEDEVYKEAYAPLKRSETSIPLSKITSVTTFNFLWIFRSIIIFQYHQMPLIFMTWNNQEFKDKFDELVNGRKEDIQNDFESKNMISFIDKKLYPIIGGIAGGLVVLFIIISTVMSLVSGTAKVSGLYVNGDEEIKLNKDGTCALSKVENYSDCNWTYNEDFEQVTLSYKYQYKLYSRTYDDTKSLTFNYSKNTLTSGSKTYTKK